MPDDDEKPNPLEDLRKGLGLLFRAAKTTIEKLPTGELEEAVVSGAKEVGRAIENVAHTVEAQVLRKPQAGGPRVATEPPPASGASGKGAAGTADSSASSKSEPPK